MKRKKICCLALTLLLLLSGCSAGETPKSAGNPETMETSRPEATSEPEAGSLPEAMAPEKPSGPQLGGLLGSLESSLEAEQPTTTAAPPSTEPPATTPAPTFTAAESLAPGNRELTQEELDFFSQYLSQADNYGFLLSSYTRPQDADLDMVFYSGAGMVMREMSQEELQALDEAVGLFGTDVFRLTTEQINALLQEKTGYTLEEFTQFRWTYLPEYDCYYTEHGDTNRTTYTCTGGRREGDLFYLDSISTPYTFHTVLRWDGSRYLFVSNETDW